LYVSTVEGRHYPFFATQWHPEKPPYEFSDKTIPHTRTAIDAASFTASLFVDVARLNSHSVEYPEQVKLVIDNYDRHFVAAEGKLDEEDPLPDTLWFVPKPENARTDPENYPFSIVEGASDTSDTSDLGFGVEFVVGLKGERDVQLNFV
jgi:gamma-glutamyl hydrolase